MPQHSVKLAKSLLLCGILLLLSCNSERAGYGVLLWSPFEDRIATGTVVFATARGKTSEQYSVQSMDGDISFAVHEIKVRFFYNRSSAERSALEYQRYASLYAVVKVDVQLRKRPKRNSRPVTALQGGTFVKIAGLKTRKIGNWYQVLTGNGTAGYIFGSDLSVVGVGDDIDSYQDIPRDIIEHFLEHEWQPEYLLNNNQQYTGYLGRAIGLFPDQNYSVVLIRTTDYEVLFHYEYIERKELNVLIFHGTPLVVEIENNDRLEVRYIWQGNELSEHYIPIVPAESNDR